jgi:hypothetical protein
MVAVLAVIVLAGGLHGVVTRGPTMPVCKVGSPCTAPDVGADLVFSNGGRAIRHVRTGAGGHYSVRLAPGLYRVRLNPMRRIGFGLRPVTVRVTAGVNRRVDFSIDTGIR